MEKIGERLKQRRQELGYSLEDIHEKTKLSIVHLRAIEEGDIAYFRHDMSYLKFFLQYYAQSIHLDFSEIEEQYNQAIALYDETVAIQKQEQLEKSNQYIKERISENRKTYGTSQKTGINLRKTDLRSIIILFLIVLIGGLLIYGAIRFLPQILQPTNNGNDIVVPTPIDTSPAETIPETVIVETTDVETEVIEPNTEVKLVDRTNFDVFTHQVETVSIKFVFGQDTWIRAEIDGVMTNNPASTVYKGGESIEIIIDPLVQEVVSVRFGHLINTQIFVNDLLVEVDPSIKDYKKGITLNFTVRSNESSE